MSKITRRNLLGACSGSLLLYVTPTAAWAKAAEAVAVRIWPASAYTRMTLETDAALTYKYFALSDPDRLVVDIQGATLNPVLLTLPQKVLPLDPYIASVRVGQFNPETVRVVFDLKAGVNPQVFTLKPIANFKHRLVVDLYPSAAVALAEEQNDPLMALLQDYNRGQVRSDGTTTAQAQVQTPPVAKPSETALPPQSGKTDTPPKTQQAGKRPPRRQAVVVLDPGHGGEDPGAIGPSGLREKNVVLAVARETKRRLDAMGYKTHMTRNEDVFIPLGVRVAKARSLKADVFVSIHADAFTNPSARGTGVYALSRKGATSAAARFLAQTQNNADSIGGVRLSNDKTVNSTLIDLTQTATINDSLRLGRGVLTQLGKINKLHKGHVDQANFAVLRAPDIPSILVETAFISNPTEEKLLASADFRKKLGNSIATGIKAYLDTAVLARR
ncbi:N-acetylmuramoyl-L-alanine amidase [Neisseria sp. HSC-16F19]|nr:N-acetylmuramoyl-L-alanine amidase [Neisseria sp. HSC-16F19]MCP2040281.1 N-acetylmuramoyl-L-alanine amidase [Neisseria sp. HSC-16F19]